MLDASALANSAKPIWSNALAPLGGRPLAPALGGRLTFGFAAGFGFAEGFGFPVSDPPALEPLVKGGSSATLKLWPSPTDTAGTSTGSTKSTLALLPDTEADPCG